MTRSFAGLLWRHAVSVLVAYAVLLHLLAPSLTFASAGDRDAVGVLCIEHDDGSGPRPEGGAPDHSPACLTMCAAATAQLFVPEGSATPGHQADSYVVNFDLPNEAARHLGDFAPPFNPRAPPLAA